MRQIVVLDTNVLLADPNVVLSFPRAEVVVPEPVLGELDKLKTARVDPDLRFRGREVSRLLFELSEDGSLVEGVDLPDGGKLRVAPLDGDTPLPDGLSTRNADDRILATAFQVCKTVEPDCDVTLVTNDLNMLLKAQTYGVPVRRHGDGVEGSFARRYIIRPFQRYKVPITILAVAVAVFAAVVVLVVVLRPAASGSASLPREFKSLLSASQQTAYDALVRLEANPDDPEALLAMANFYFDQVTAAQSAGDRVTALGLSQNGIRYYKRYLLANPNDNEAHADLASLLFYAGQTDQAIQEVGKVLERDANHVNANYNLGVILWQGRRDFEGAAQQFRKVVKLTESTPELHTTRDQARLALQQVAADAEASGRPVETTTTPGGTQ